MKDKLIALAKDNKINLILLIIVLVVSSVLFKMSFQYQSETALLKEEQNKLQRDTTEINTTKFRLDDSNLRIVAENVDSYKEGFNEFYQTYLEKYNHPSKGVEDLSTEDAQDLFNETIEGLNKICINSRVEIPQNYQFSFDGVADSILKIKDSDRVIIFEQLNAIKSIMIVLGASKVSKLLSLQRVNGLNKTKTKEAYTDVYSFVLNLELSSNSLAEFLNRLANDPSYFYKITYLDVKSNPQVDKDLRSLRVAPDVKKEKAIDEVDQMLLAADKNADEKAEPSKPRLRDVNPQAYNMPMHTVVIKFDWVQFKDSYLETK